MMNLTLTENCSSVEIVSDSEVISQVGYSRDDNELYVEFTNGSVYYYVDVPASVYTEFVNSKSLGRFFNTEIATTFDGYLLEETF